MVGRTGSAMMSVITAPALNGIHHLKVHVTDVRRPARWYARTLEYQPPMEFADESH
jgi:hypothetical protein